MHPRESSALDYEAELAVVIGQRGRRIHQAGKAITSNLSSTRRVEGTLTTTNEGSVSDRMQRKRADVRRKRLLFRCWHRGTQEGDLIFGGFAEAYLADFDLAQLERFEALLDCTDPDLYDWIVVGIAPPEEYDHDVMSLLRAFARRPKKRN